MDGTELRIAMNAVAEEMAEANHQMDAALLKDSIMSYLDNTTIHVSQYINHTNTKLNTLIQYMIDTLHTGKRKVGYISALDPLHHTEDDVYTYYYPLVRGNPSWYNTWYNYSTPYFWWLPSGFSIVL